MLPLRTEILATLLEILCDVFPPRPKNSGYAPSVNQLLPPPLDTNPGCAPAVSSNSF